MRVPDDEWYKHRDIFIDYAWEQVMFRYEAATERRFGKFYGESEEFEVHPESNLWQEARWSGEETDANSYQAGKPRT